MRSDRPPAPASPRHDETPSWSPGPRDPRLDPGSLHVWRVDLDAVGNGVIESLDDAEHARASRIVTPRDRRIWSRSRGALRTLLGRYLRIDPSAIELAHSEHGKPLLGPSHGPAAPAFSLSHSATLALFAFVAEGDVGVDLEVVHPRRKRAPHDGRLSLARRSFGADAARPLERLSGATREREFLRLWVRYEAERKRRGTGIGRGDSLAASPPPPSGAATSLDSDAGPWIADLDIGPRAAAALALGSRASELRRWEWP